MSWRKWLVRGLVFSIAGAVACAALLYQRWTNPVAIRQQVLSKLRELFPGATVTLDSARLELLGGIRFTELRLVRHDDQIAYVPSGVLYHNKEEVLDGKLSFRKIELDRLHLHVHRGPDGRWNLAGLTAPGRSTDPLPMVVVHQATILFDDQYGQASMLPLEINNANLTLVNDPLPTVMIDAQGTSAVLGGLKLRGGWQRDTRELTLEVQALGVPLSPQLVKRVAAYCSANPVKGLLIDGRADIGAIITYQPQQPLRYDVSCQLKQVSLEHRELLPVPLDKLDASLRCMNGKLVLERLSARAHEAEVEAHGVGVLPLGHGDSKNFDFDGVLSVKHLTVCNELIAHLEPPVQKLYSNFGPSGPVTLTYEGARQSGQWMNKHCVLQPEGASARFHKFPYLLERFTGTLDLDLMKNAHRINLAAYAGTQPVRIQGTWNGVGDKADVHIDIVAEGIPIDKKLMDALPQGIQSLAHSFHPTGRGDCRVLVRHVPGRPADEFANEYQVAFRNATMKWDDFSYPLEEVSGLLQVHPKYWEFSGFRGTHHGGTVTVRGRSFERLPGAGPEIPMIIDIEGRNVNLDADLAAALHALKKADGLGKAWDTFAPQGRMNFAARIDRSPGQQQDLDVAVEVHGCTIEPCFFPYPLTDLSGRFRYARNRVTLTGVSARHNGTRVLLGTGLVDLAPDGAYYADLKDLQSEPLFIDPDLLKAMPEKVRDFVTTLQLQDPLVARTQLIISQEAKAVSAPVIYWDGQLWMRDARVKAGVEFEHVTGTAACQGRLESGQIAELSGNVLLDQASCFHQPLQNLHARLRVDKDARDVLHLGLKAPLFGGEISGEGRVELTSYSRHHYELNLTASQINLEQFGTHNLGPGHRLSGLAQARLILWGQGSAADSLEGEGKIDVPDGKLVRLPFLLDLLKFLGLRSPDGTAFQEAHAAFGIHDKRVTVNQLNLVGNPISLSGNGGVNLDGSDVQMNFYTTWGRTEQIPLLRTVPAAISKTLWRIEVRGKIGSQTGDLQFSNKLVPALSDSVNRMSGAAN